MKVLTSIFIFTLVLGTCHAQEPASPGTGEPVTENYVRGQYEVSRTWIEITEGAHRISLFVHVPVLGKVIEPAPVLPTPEWQQLHAAHLERKVGTAHHQRLAAKKFLHAKDGRNTGEKSPVLIFGPGYTWLPSDYYELLLPLVRSGIIVVTVSAPPVSKVVQFPDGTILQRDPQLDYDTQAGIIAITAREILQMNADKKHVLYDKVDTSRIVAGGHSLSGAAALAAAAKEPVIKAVINLDGDVTESIGAEAISQPILYITSQPPQVSETDPAKWSADRSETRRDRYFETNSSRSRNAIRIKVPGMFHLDFLDVSFLKSKLPERLVTNRFGSIEPEEANRIVTTVMRSFILDPYTKHQNN